MKGKVGERNIYDIKKRGRVIMVKKKEIGIYRKLKEVMEKGKNEVIEED